MSYLTLLSVGSLAAQCSFLQSSLGYLSPNLLLGDQNLDSSSGENRRTNTLDFYSRGLTDEDSDKLTWRERLQQKREEREAQESQTYYVDQEWYVSQMDTEQSYYISPWNDRVQVIINTDKVVYRPGDVVFIEAFVIDAIEKIPLATNPDDFYYYNYYATFVLFDPS